MSSPARGFRSVVVPTSSREERGLTANYRLGMSAYVVKLVNFHEFLNAVKETREELGRVLVTH
jgi:hypothetical protein